MDAQPSPESICEQASFCEQQPLTQYFQGQAPPAPLRFGYKLGLGIVLLAMVALPLIYLGLIGLAAGGIYFYATNGAKVLFPIINGTRHTPFFFICLYLAPIAAGVILIFFMIKPIFSGFRIRQLSIPIGHVENPELFRFLGQLCQLLGAPIPSRVDVQLGVNAFAGFRAGFTSMFGNDIMLTIGLPLIAGLNCREFAGVLAHELGHFRQHTAMRFRYLIGSINAWFARAVYQRDEHDQWLVEETNTSAFSLFAFVLARVALAFTRGILWLLMICGHAISSFMYRQMEFDADACALAVAGTDAFLTLHHKLRVLDFSQEQIFAQYKNKVQPKLPDDLSTYIAVMASQCAGETQGKVLRAAAGRKARWYDSHPSDAARNERARLANLPGLIQDTRPATCLFGNFPQLSKTFTSRVYSFFRRPPRRDQLFAVEAPANIVPDTTREEAAVKTFFAGLGPIIKPILWDADTRISVGAAADKLAQLRQAKALLASADLLQMREDLKATDARLLEALQRQALVQAGLLEEIENVTSPEATLEQINHEWDRLRSVVEPCEKAARDRLLVLLSLVRTPAMAAAIENTQNLQDEVHDLSHVFAALSFAFPCLLALRKQFAKLQAVLPYRGQGRSEFLDAVVQNETAEARRLLDEIHKTLGSTAYPFAHVKGHASLIDYARTKEFVADPVLMICKESESHLQMLFALYFQLLGRLTAIASQIEQQLELEARAKVVSA